MKKTRLRALTISDLPLTLKWHNQADIKEMYSGHPFPVNEEMERRWYEKILTSNIPVTVFEVESLCDSRLVGITLLKDINMINRSAEFAIYIGSLEDRGKGYSTCAMRNTLDFAFNKLGLNRVWLKARSDNTPGITLYKRCGFKEEGRLREATFKGGKFVDELVLSLLKNEYRELFLPTDNLTGEHI